MPTLAQPTVIGRFRPSPGCAGVGAGGTGTESTQSSRRDNTRVIMWIMWEVLYLPEAERERGELPEVDAAALINADAKLRALGPRLGYPHSSAVQGVRNLRELRPRSGRCRWRAFYRQVGNVFIVGAVGPEAMVDKHGFARACQVALTRLAQVEEG